MNQTTKTSHNRPHAWAMPIDTAIAIPMPTSTGIGTGARRQEPLRPGSGGRGGGDPGAGQGGGKVSQQVLQLTPGSRGQRPARSFVELLGRQPARLEVLTQVRQDRVAVGIGSLHRSRGIVP